MTFNFNEPPLRVAVLGGGAAGMTAAWELAGAGARVTLLEREPLVGGLCATHERDGWRFDLGGHRFISRSSELVTRVRALLGEDLLERQRRSVILHRGRAFRYPLDARDLLGTLPWVEGAAALASYLGAHLGGARLDERSFEGWVVRRFGRHLYDRFFGPYTEKLWGVPAAQISSDWAAERISLLDLGDAALRAVGLRRGGRPRSYARGYFYPRRGIGHIFEAMAGAVRAHGGEVRLGAVVVGLARGGDGRVREVRWRDAAGEHALACDAVLSTLSLPRLAHMLAPRADVARHARALRYRAVRFLNLMLARAEVTPNTWMYVSDARILPTRIQEPRHRSPEMAPPGMSSLMLELPCDVGDAVWRASDAALRARCLAQLATLGVPALRGLDGDVRGVFSTFVAEGYPMYTHGYREHRGALLDHVAAAPNLLSIGRQGTFRYLFMDVAMEMGVLAARQLLAGAPRQADMLRFRDEGRLIETQSVTA